MVRGKHCIQYIYIKYIIMNVYTIIYSFFRQKIGKVRIAIINNIIIICKHCKHHTWRWMYRLQTYQRIVVIIYKSDAYSGMVLKNILLGNYIFLFFRNRMLQTFLFI